MGVGMAVNGEKGERLGAWRAGGLADERVDGRAGGGRTGGQAGERVKCFQTR